MSNIGEAQITRLTRERLAAIKKFLPVRDSFRNNLQARQQARMDFTTDTQQLFALITTATKEVVTATERVGKETERIGKETEQLGRETAKIASRTKETKKYLKTLPFDVVATQSAQQHSIVPLPEKSKPKIYHPDEIFTPTTLMEILNKNNPNELARYAYET